MKRFLLAVLALLLVAPAHAAKVKPAPPSPQAVAEQLRAQGQDSELAFTLMAELVTGIGPRQAGTPAEAAARDWAIQRLASLGLRDARVEPFTMKAWVRTREEAVIVAALPQPLVIHALGYSPSTPQGGVEGALARFETMEGLNAVPLPAPGAAMPLAGKIVFLDERMERTPTGFGYAMAVRKRRACAPAAVQRGALACLIRTVGTSPHRFANTGMMGDAGLLGALPAAAVSNVDADRLATLLGQGEVRVRLDIQTATDPAAPSGNVVADIRGRERPDEIVLLAAHIDSWDVTPGAQDDAVGVGVVMAAAKLIAEMPGRPRRTIRIVLYGAEEVGILGARAYAERHKAALSTHMIAVQADSGAGRILKLETKFGAGAGEAAAGLRAMAAPLGIAGGGNAARGGPDLTPLVAVGVPVVDFAQDMSGYFDIHHTPNDTLAQIDPANVKQMTAAYASFAWLAAEVDWDFRAPAPAAGAGIGATPAP